ncbi:TetR/AcrR family transcriptional regulator [Simplicispira psychrophila]|uniref:TetR/AcrR family transcriptional regulator n=1 Tax=Simplicispira psychrophila TaxID=80882 RepID=UPI0004888637|nr:TetR/AcrR family transcriptional regulator [Simplicispira psychrophila]
MASRTSPTPASTVPPELSNRRQDILDAALACATAHGVDALSIEHLRAHCGASVGSIYHHFGNKEGVVAALFFDIFKAQSRSVQAQLDAAVDAQGGVRALVTGYLDWVVAQPAQARFLFQARNPVATGPRAPDLVLAAQQRHQALRTWFEPHRASGAVRSLPCELLPSLVMGPVQSYCRAWLAAPDGLGALPSPDTYREELAAAAWRAVRT